MDRPLRTYSRRVLLIALGTTPHLTTVTLSALYKTYPNEMPTEIHVVTTARGAQIAREKYMATSVEDNLLKSFYRDYGLSEVRIPEDHIHVIPDENGEPLDDIRTQDDGSRAADFIVHLVRDICSDPDSSLHVSIVGGRKSMSLLLGSAMTFYGRDQDRISHVLSSEAQESSREAYPSRKTLESDPDAISLGEIPFLRLRPILPKPLIDAQYTYGEIVSASQQKLTDQSSVRLFKRKGKWILVCEGIEIKVEPRLLGLYLWLAWRTKVGRETEMSFNSVTMEELFFLRIQCVRVLKDILSATVWENNAIKLLGMAPDRLAEIERHLRHESFTDAKAYYRRVFGLMTLEERRAVTQAAEKFSSNLSPSRTKFNETIEQALSAGIPDVTMRRIRNYQIESNEEKRNGCVYRLNLPADCIELPEDFLVGLRDRNDHPVDEWKRV